MRFIIRVGLHSMEVKKSHGLLSASCKTSEISGVIHSHSEGLKIGGAEGISPHPSPRVQEPGAPMFKGRR